MLGEIKTLTLGDLDWQEGLIRVRGKAGRYSQLPLPADVGAAIADYLRNAEARNCRQQMRVSSGESTSRNL